MSGEEKLELAIMFAIRNHGLQEYDGFPYHKHLKDVDNVGKMFTDDNELRMGLWLHDILEDTHVSYSDIEKLFGKRVAEMVFCVTDELGRNRDERKGRTYPKIRSNSDAIFIKLADRIANTENCIAVGHGMMKRYTREYAEFKKALFVDNHCLEMWARLDALQEITFS